jgi:hypothetical protein
MTTQSASEWLLSLDLNELKRLNRESLGDASDEAPALALRVGPVSAVPPLRASIRIATTRDSGCANNGPETYS